MISIKTELLDRRGYTEADFRTEVRGMIQFAINEKEYLLEELSIDMIAEDITGIFGEHQMSEEGLNIINEELAKVREQCV